jgi:acetyl esterase/lipase
VKITVDRAIAYAEKDGYRHLELDVYRPEGSDGVPLPLLHYVHGGGWRVSSRQRAPRETRAWVPGMFEQLAAAGFVVAASDYRFSAEALYPAAIEDTLDAHVFLRSNADRFGIDPARAVLFGQSAGGYLAAAVGLGTDAPPVQGIVCWYPLTDFSALADDDPASGFPSQWLGAPLSTVPELVERARVPRLARADAPPVLLQHGTADTMAPFDQSVRLRDALAACGASVQLDAIDGAEHFFGDADDATVRQIFRRAIDFAVDCVSRPGV